MRSAPEPVLIHQDPALSIAAMARDDRAEDGRGMLLRRLGAGAADFARDADGVPMLLGDSRAVSVSHTEELLVVALCEEGPVGVDAEPLDRRFDAGLFEEYALSPLEREALPRFERVLGLGRREVVLTLWALKESWTKAARVPLVPRSTSFELDDAGRWRKAGSAARFGNFVSCGHIVAYCVIPAAETPGESTRC